MAARQLARARSLQEKRAEPAPLSDEDSSSEEETVTAPRNAFDLLCDDGDDAQVSDEDEAEEEKAAPATSAPPAADDGGAPEASSKKKKKKKRGGGKGKSKAEAEEEEEDEIDRTLKELGIAPPPTPPPGAAGASGSGRAAGPPLLGVDVRYLRAEEELRRMFGTAVLHAAAAEGGGGGGARRRGAPAGRGGVAPTRHLRGRGGLLIRPKDTWPPHTGGTGLSMDVRSGRAPGEQLFSFTHAASWTAAQAEYDACVASHDPNELADMLHDYPYHVDALLSLSELYGYTNEAARAADVLERALYALECAWHPALPGALAAGTARMDGSTPENAPFFGAVFRHVGLLGRKGCVRTALELCKMLLCLDPSDPRGVLCCVDYFALRAGEQRWLLRFGAAFRGDGALPTLPGWAFSLAMAAWSVENDKAGGASGSDASADAAADEPRADERLRDALLLHPAVLPRLMERLTASNAVTLDAGWRAVLAAPLFTGATCGDSASLEHLVDIFLERHSSLWRPAAVLAWLKRGAEAAVASAGAAADWALLRDQAFPPAVSDAYLHLVTPEFGDAATRALPAEDNPFLAPRRPRGGEMADDAMMAVQEAMAGLPAPQRAQLEQGLQQAMAAGGGEAERQNALMLFLRTLFRPDAGGAAGAPPPRQPPPGAEGMLHEEGDSEEEEFEEIPEEWRRQWAEERRGAGGDGGGDAAAQDWDAPD